MAASQGSHGSNECESDKNDGEAEFMRTQQACSKKYQNKCENRLSHVQGGEVKDSQCEDGLHDVSSSSAVTQSPRGPIQETVEGGRPSELVSYY